MKFCYENFLHQKVKVVLCDVKHCFNILHHMCQNNIDHTKFDEGFEEKVGIVFHCRACMSKSMIPENITGKISKPSNKV